MKRSVDDESLRARVNFSFPSSLPTRCCIREFENATDSGSMSSTDYVSNPNFDRPFVIAVLRAAANKP